MALDLRSATVNAADWKIPSATSRGLSLRKSREELEALVPLIAKRALF
jgi:hypothetical protein